MVRLSVRDGVAWLTLDRPAALNALNAETVQAFEAHVRSLHDRSDVRVVVTQGTGRSFCAGSDLRELAGMSPAVATEHELRVARCFSLLDQLPQPTIAALHGHVLGGGLGVALYHDFRIAATDAILSLPEVELGWTPPWAVGRLVDVVGLSQSRRLLLTAERISGTEAARIGLVDQAVGRDALEEAVKRFAARLIEMPPEGLARTKKLLCEMSLFRQDSWDDAAAAAFLACYDTPEAQARVAAFLARKKKV